MHRRHFHIASVTIALGMALAGVVLVHTTTPSLAAPRSPITISTEADDATNILLANQTNVMLDRFTLRAGREDMTVTTLSFTNCVASGLEDADGDCADEGETPGDDRAITSATLLYNDGTYDRRARGTLQDGVLTFAPLVLPLVQGVDTPVALRVTTAPIDGTTVTSGMQLQLNVNAMAAPFTATGADGTAFTEHDVRKHARGTAYMLRATLPTLTLSPDAPSGFVDDAMTEVFRLDVNAAASGDVALSSLTFGIAVQTNGGGNWNTCPFLGADTAHVALVDTVTGETVPATFAFSDSHGTVCTESENDVAYVSATFATPVVIPEGTMATYALSIDASYASTDAHDTIRAFIPTATELNGLPTPLSAITWSDGTTEGVALDGTALTSLPVNGNLLVF